MAQADIHVDAVDFEIAPGIWLCEVLELKAVVECPANQVEDWWLVEVEIVNHCHVGKTIKLDHGSGNRDLFERLERALRRHDEKDSCICDELTESYWSGDHGPEYEKEYA